jgi:RHS repeat-associated protein
MANKSATSGQVITLPKGGGALHGIGEKFSPDLFTGTGNFTVPIALPPGRNGFQPQLNLVYSTGNGNGPFGLGWSLSIPGVSRKTSKGVPRYEDERDVFILSGAEDLVPVEQQSDATTRYRPRTEGLFARILHHRSIKENYWEVRSKDGLVSLYGTPRPDPVPADWSDPSVVQDPEPLKQRHIFAWKLTETRDPFGNRIQYKYMRDSGEQGAHKWDQPLLNHLHYADYGDQGDTKFLISVTFDYEERTDQFSEYRSGFEIRTTKRCRRIIVQTHAGQNRSVREYSFKYEYDPRNSVSLLRRVEVIGFDDNGQPLAELPPLEFGYTTFEPEQRKFEALSGSLPASSLASPGVEMVDLFGNGLPDILEMNGTVRYWRNLGDGKFDLQRQMQDAPGGLHLADAGVQMIDANGDGRSDLLVTQNGLAGYFPLQFNGQWNRRSFQRYQRAPSFNLEDPEVRLVDLDGDGVTDAIRSGTRLECFFNDSHTGWNGTRWVERKALDVFPNVNFSDPRVKWGDMSGDGLQDIVLVYDGNVEYWPNLGHGDWCGRLHMSDSPRFPYGYDPKRILLGDVDGDGLADIVYVDHGKVTLWINQSGNGWSEPIEIDGTPPMTDMDSVRLADIKGSGVSGVLWSTDANGLERRTLWFLDFTGGLKPYLLNVMDNHMGALTKVQYAPSTRFYLADEKERVRRWRTPLPFPVQTVRRVEVIDEISGGKLTTEYRYHHGYWDGAEREFRGFGMVEQLDTETFEDYNGAGLHGGSTQFVGVNPKHFSSPTLTKTWFHQGPVGEEFGEWEELDYAGEYWLGDPQILKHTESVNAFLKTLTERRAKRDALRTLRGSILRTELYALDGSDRQDRPYTVTESAYGLREEFANEQERPRIFFSHSTAQRTTQWERGDDPMTQFTFTGDYNEYGQARSQISIAVPRGREFRQALGPQAPAPEPYLSTHTLTDYAKRDDPESYIVDRVARTTTYEIPNDGRDDLFSLAREIASNALDDPGHIIGQTLNFYDGAEFEGLPFGQIDTYGALMRTETLVLTESILDDAYGSQRPPYLVSDGSVNWSADYLGAFRDQLPTLAGYTFHPGDAVYAEGYYAMTERRRYDFHMQGSESHGLVITQRDALGHDTTIEFDAPYHLLPFKVIDPVGLTSTAAYNYRVMQPALVTDPNGNQTEFRFSPTGLLKETWLKGKPNQGEGDLGRPSARMEYDFLRFEHDGGPIFVRTIRHVHHDTETDVSLPEHHETIETREYSDGFGRLLQTRTQGEDVRFGDEVFGGGESVLPALQIAGAGGDVTGKPNSDSVNSNVVVSGWQTYDNKGRVVEKYEPFFDVGWEFDPPEDRQLGQKATMHYDPRGQVIRTVNPDGSEQRVIYGVPIDLSAPENFTPTPWEAYTYDANDNAGRTHAATSSGYSDHWNTPSSIGIDALGRTVIAVARNGTSETNWFITQSTYDIQGNLLTVTDALERIAFKHVYDLAKHPLRIDSIDAGIRQTVLDAIGNAIEGRDSKGSLVLHAYDLLNRPIRLWARDDGNSAMTLRERLEYGDGSDPNQPAVDRDANRAMNRLGKLRRHYDEAGRVTVERYDFKGNVLEKMRQVIGDAGILNVFDPPRAKGPVRAYRVDWRGGDPSALLDPTEYRTSTSYDGLSRIKSLRYPQDVDKKRAALQPKYNRAGALESVALDGETYVERIAYNAKGQRTLIAYGNQVMTRYAYDEQTFRLVRLRTEGYTKPNHLTYHPIGAPLQDFAYEYDLSGNILAIHDRTPGCGVPALPNRLDRAFTYDPLYRLLSATGRERDLPPATPPWEESPQSMDVTKTRAYTEIYTYDKVGNILQLQHIAGNNGNFTREFALLDKNNRLERLTVGPTRYDYVYDANGNLVGENADRHFEWDYSDRMRAYSTQAGNAPPSLHAHYLYDAAGQRVTKLVRRQGGAYEVMIYIDGLFEHHRRIQGKKTEQNNTLHVMDNQSRIALVRVGQPFDKDTTPAVKYHLGDHLGSSNVVIGGPTSAANDSINREEYTPYGETSFGSFAKKRYRFTGKERDEESGLYYHGARYYAPWLARWVSCDPIGMAGGINLYSSMGNNPTILTDPDGRQPNPPIDDDVHNVLLAMHAEAGFEQGKAQPPPVDPNPVSQKPFGDPSKVASPAGTKAHNRTVDILNEMKNRGVKGAERVFAGVRVRNGVITHVGVNPGKGADNLDVLVVKPGVGNPVGQRVSDIGEMIGDFKYGGGAIDPKYAKYGLPLMTIDGRSLPASTLTSASGSDLNFASKARGRVGQILGALGKGAGFLGTASDLEQMGKGFISIAGGDTATGLVDVGESGANLALDYGVPALIKAGLVRGGAAAGGLTLAAGAAAAASIGLAAETVRAALKGQKTPYEIAVEFYGKGFRFDYESMQR